MRLRKLISKKPILAWGHSYLSVFLLHFLMIKFSCGSSRVWWPHLCSLLLVRVWNALLCLEKALQPLRALEPWDHPCCDWLLSRVRGQNPWPRRRKHKKCSVHIQKGSCYYCTEWCFDAIALNFISLYLLNFWLLVSPGWIILAEKHLIKFFVFFLLLLE